MKTKNTASRRRAGEKLSVDSGSRMSDPYWSLTFSTVKTAKIRLLITRSKDDVSRIWELELYGPLTP